LNKIAGLVKSSQKFKAYEIVILTVNEEGQLFFDSVPHFSRFSIQSKKDVYKEIVDNMINIIAVDSILDIEFKEIVKELSELAKTNIKVEFKSVDQSYIVSHFVNDLSQIRRESDLWKVQMQDKLRNRIRGIDGPCDGVYASDVIDGFILALSII